jgi:hypothetical protein
MADKPVKKRPVKAVKKREEKAGGATAETPISAEAPAAAEAAPAVGTKLAPKKREQKRSIWPAAALIAGIVIFFVVVVGLVAFRTSPKTPSGSQTTAAKTSKSTTDPNNPNIVQKETPSSAPSKEDEEKYKGWQTYENQTWAILARYPAEWTKTETSGNPSVTFLGPPTPAGGVILNECSVSISFDEIPAGMTLNAYMNAARSKPLGGGAMVEETETSIGDSAALKVVDTYTDIGVPWKRLRIWTIKNGRGYTFNFSASINYGGTDYYTIHSTMADMILASVVIS